MRNRFTTAAAVAIIGTIGGLMLFGGSGEPLPSGSTTLPATTSTITTTVAPTTTAATTTAPTPATTTTNLRPTMTLTVTNGQASPNLVTVVTGFYTWLVDRSADEPDIPDGLAAHVKDIESGQSFDLMA